MYGILYYRNVHGGVLLFDTHTAKRKYLFPAIFPNATTVCSTGTKLVFSTDSHLLAVGEDKGDGDHGILQLWDTWTGKRRSILKTANEFPTAFSPDSTLLLSCNSNKDAHLWNTQTGQVIAKLQGQTAGPFSFSPDSTLLASGGYNDWDNRALLWDTRTGQVIRKLVGHFRGSSVTSIAFSPDGTTLATGSDDGTVKLWRIK